MRVPADFAVAYRLAVHGLIASGFAALLLTGDFAAGYGVLVVAAMSQAWWRRAKEGELPHMLELLAGALLVGLVAADLGVFSAGLPRYRLLARTVAHAQLLALLMPESSRVYRVQAGLSFLHMLAAAALTTGIGFLFATAAYVVSLTWALILFQVADGMRRSPGSADNQWRSLVSGPVIARITGVALVVFALTASLFFVIPRYGAGYFFSRGEDTQTAQGFTEDVVLGALGEVKQNSEVVMRVVLPDLTAPPDRSLYWRGVALDVYDGTSWRRSRSKVLQLTPDEQGFQERTYRISPAGDVLPCTAWLRQMVFLNPPDTTVLFAAARLQGVRGKFSRLTVDENVSTRAEFPAFSSYAYEAISSLNCFSHDQLREATWNYPAWVKSVYLQLPPNAKEVAELAVSVTAKKKRPYGMALAIEQHLKRNYAYTLSLSDIDPERPLEDFLFRRKAGHCEFFATAMAVMLRCVGVPSRLVNGYQMGEWNELGRYFVVRSSDAHSWVEAYFPEVGWVEFDPTPEAGLEVHEDFSWVSAVLLAWDSVKLSWKRTVIEYHLLDQLEYLRAAATELRRVGQAARVSYRSLRVKASQLWRFGGTGGPATLEDRLPALLAGGVALAATVLLVLAVARRKRRAAGQDGRIEFYERLVRVMARRGLRRLPAATPMEFARQAVAREPEDLAGVDEITRLYYRARYGLRLPDASERERLEQLLARLEAPPDGPGTQR